MDEFELDLAQAKPIPEDHSDKHTVIVIFILFLLAGIVAAVLVALLNQNILFKRTAIKTNAASSKMRPILRSTPTPTLASKEIIGFLPYWITATKKPVKTDMLDQIIFFGLPASSSGNLIMSDELATPYMDELKKQASASGTKVLVTVSNFDNAQIESIIFNKKNSDNLIQEIRETLRTYQLDGVNIDFEYFTDGNFPIASKMNMFLQDLVVTLKKENPRYIVSFDVNALSVLIDGNYDMAKIGEVVDQVILMAYDYYRKESTTSGPVSPLYGKENENTVARSLNSMIGRVPKEKIIVAVPFFGYEWETEDSSYKSKVYEGTGAIATYERVQDLIKNRSDVVIQRDPISFSPWITYRQSGTTKQIYYEDTTSLGKKIDFIHDQKLGGLGIWALGYEGDYQDLWQTIDSSLAGNR